MEQAEIRVLLEKYWRAETTVGEERELAEFFRQAEIPADLEPVRGVFVWRDEEAEVRPGADFDRRVLERIRAMEDEGTSGARVARDGVVRGFSIRFAAAAAVILCLGIGLLIPAISPGPGGAGLGGPGSVGRGSGAPVSVGPGLGEPGSGGPGIGGPSSEPMVAGMTITDTYTDPNKALAAVRKALLVASVRMNTGTHITQKNITRLRESWRAATGD
ncbi:MAG TPA: hypothetical protein VL978_03775 [Puia sp.]|nr:hypothetical protein [Puia sp.]